jgi:holo-[acyl-carrier protein] synthase
VSNYFPVARVAWTKVHVTIKSLESMGPTTQNAAPMKPGSEETSELHARALRVGTDLVQISRIAESIEQFGEKFIRRLFTEGEIAYATSSVPLQAERFAARFAAKEATIKALSLADVGLDWKHIEVQRAATGECTLKLHGAAHAAAIKAGIRETSVSLSHDGDYATAVVVCLAAC